MSSLRSCYFTTSKGRTYTIVKTEYGKTSDVLSAIDTVVNQEGIRKTMSRSETLKLIKS